MIPRLRGLRHRPGLPPRGAACRRPISSNGVRQGFQMQRRVMPFACALAFGVGAISYARADGLQPCAVEPFGEQPVDVQEAILRRGCGGEHTRWYVETPRAKESDPGPSMVRTQFDS